jgi:hypothetical protein
MHFSAPLVLLLAAQADAFWRMPCRARSGLARLDPLVSPGEISGHVHAIHGSSGEFSGYWTYWHCSGHRILTWFANHQCTGFSETSTSADLLAGECTSCQVSQDKSAYWTPALYFQHSNGNFELVQQVGGMLA